MKAVIIKQFGASQVMELVEQSTPKPKDDEVLVKIKATSINPVDIQTRRGDYKDAISLPAKLGVDCAGIIEAVGKHVQNLNVGDEVYYVPRLLENEGSYATHHIEKAAIIAKKPATITFEEAATLPLSAGTAWECLVERGRLKAGDNVLIHGGSGGVGVYALQIAKYFGAHVVTTCNNTNEGFVKQLGADQYYDYKSAGLYEKIYNDHPNGFDIILDTVGQKTIENSLALLAHAGKIVSIVDMSTPQNLINGWSANGEIHFVFTTQSARRLADMADVIDKGGIKPILERTMMLTDIVAAHDLIEAGTRKGKIAIVING